MNSNAGRRPPSLSLQARLTLLYGGLFLVAGAVMLSVLYLVVEHRLDQQLTSGDTESRLAVLRAEAARSTDSTVTMPDGSEVALDQLVADVRTGQEQIKEAALDTLLTRGSLAVVGVGLVAGLAGWAVAGRGLRPLHAITTTAQRIARSSGVERDLDERIALRGRDDDIRRLADSFDAMLDNLDRAFDTQRRFVANASHELRTPLAMERGLIELEITRPSATPDAVHFGRSLLEINERHTRLVNGLLFLADSQNELENPVPLDLDHVAEHVRGQLQATADELGVTLNADLRPAPTLGDPVLLEQLVRNLVENALRHNVPDGRATIRTGTADGNAQLEIGNTGPVIPQYEIEALFEPFHRRRSSRTTDDDHQGFGLGLSIVKAIVTTHQGSISAHGGHNGGLDVTVRVPIRAHTPPTRKGPADGGS